MFQSNYTAKQPNAKGYVAYTAEENLIWEKLYARQVKVIQNRACKEFLHGLELLDMPKTRIPQIVEMNEKLTATTGWQVAAVPALIPHDYFFQLLSEKKFPAATFIRRKEQFDYITEPDIFHEYFGHCPMITFPAFADFMQAFGKLGKNCNQAQQNLLSRLYWFTVEFGLIQTDTGLKTYGGGILSSPEETIYALESNIPKRTEFDLKTVLESNFRIDLKQPHYFIINDYKELYSVLSPKLVEIIDSVL